MIWFAMVVGLVASLVSLVYFVILAVGAFRRSTAWGLAVLFLPFAVLAYAIKHWSEARRPFLITTGTGVLSTVLLLVVFGSAAVQVSEAAQAQMEAEMLAATKRAQAEARRLEREGQPPQEAEAPVAPTTDEGIDRVIRVARERSEAARTIPTNLYPDEGPIPFDSARRYVGERLRVVGTNGTELSARLVAAEADRLVFEKSLGNGTASFEFTAREVTRLERLTR